jgi:hypothetical protein
VLCCYVQACNKPSLTQLGAKAYGATVLRPKNRRDRASSPKSEPRNKNLTIDIRRSSQISVISVYQWSDFFRNKKPAGKHPAGQADLPGG